MLTRTRRLALNAHTRTSSAVAPWYQQGKADGVDPTLWLDFANNRYAANGSVRPASDVLSVIRSTTGSYYDSNGILQTAAINTMRRDYDPTTKASLGVLIEEARTNLITFSETLSDATWTQQQVTTVDNSGVSPRGLSDSSLISEVVVGGIHRTYKTFVGITTGQPYSYSVYLKYSGRQFMYLNAASLLGCQANFDLVNGVVNIGAGAATIKALPNGWYRCTLTGTALVASASIFVQFNLTNSATDSSYAGLSSVGTYIWGAQLELGADVTSYIPTTSAAVTRSYDRLYNDASNVVTFASWYNALTSTFFTAFDKYTADAIARRIWDSAGGAGSGVLHTGSTSALQINDNNAQVLGITLAPPIVAAKLANTDVNNDHAASLNGAATVTFAGGGHGAMTAIEFGNRSSDGLRTLNGHIKEFRYYPIRALNATLQSLTV